MYIYHRRKYFGAESEKGNESDEKSENEGEKREKRNGKRDKKKAECTKAQKMGLKRWVYI